MRKAEQDFNLGDNVETDNAREARQGWLENVDRKTEENIVARA